MDIDDQVAAIARFRKDFMLFGEVCLRCMPKAGGKTVPLILNRAQRFVHARLEQQLRETGKVRALILKGRQQGISTLIAARFYRRTSMDLGRKALIVAHEDKATRNLFGIVKRYHEHNPLQPPTKATNAQELIFALIDGGYMLATAGSKDVGRSATTQMIHSSEFAFWENAPNHLAGLGNTLGDAPGTEHIIESTANGIGNAFHELWQKAVAGEGEFIAIFVPWWWQEEYVAPVPANFKLSDEDEQYRRAYNQDAGGLTLAQMAWRANKIATYPQGFEWLFDQEYPASAALAFKSPTGNPLISPLLVDAAMNCTFRSETGPLIIGVDPAEGVNRDRTAIAFRRGRMCFRTETHNTKPMATAALIAKYHAEFSPDAICIDRGAGAGIIDRLRELGVPCIGVAFGGRANDEAKYVNKRAEMWWLLKEWLDDTPNRLPNDPELAADLSAVGFPGGYPYDSNGRRQIESKKEMAKRQIRSPDLGDALALTFAEPVQQKDPDNSNTGTSASGHAPTSVGY